MAKEINNHKAKKINIRPYWMVKNLTIRAKVGLTDILRKNSAYLQPVNGIKAM